MKRKNSRGFSASTTAFLGLLSLTSLSFAGGGASCGDAPGCCDTPREACREACFATVETETVEKKCWDVECKKVCVPKVVCPWGEGGSGLTCFDWIWPRKKDRGGCGCTACCDSCRCEPKPRCGKVLCVRDLKAVTYECEERVCKWEIRRLPACCDACCGGSIACCESLDGRDRGAPQPAPVVD